MTTQKQFIVKSLLFVAALIGVFSEVLLKMGDYTQKNYVILGNLFVLVILSRELFTKKCRYGWIAVWCMMTISFVGILYAIYPNHLQGWYNLSFPLFIQSVALVTAFLYLISDDGFKGSISSAIKRKILGGVAIPFKPKHLKIVLGNDTIYLNTEDGINGNYDYSVYRNGCLYVTDIISYPSEEAVLEFLETNYGS
jgi:hypothetical protein